MYKPMFVPPQENPLLQQTVYALLPGLAQMIANIRDVHVAWEDFAHLEALKAHRGILTPNHPTGADPFVVMWLGRMLRQPFNYLCAREVLVGPKGWLLNQLGTYSVIRGIADRESLRTTRRLLAEHNRKVVIFPEGEIYEHNDTLLAFQSGVAQIGFWALDDLAKAGKEPALPLVPIAIKYRCSDAARPAIEASLRRLEAALSLTPKPGFGAYQRLLRVGYTMLGALETDLGIAADEAKELRDRIQEYRRKLMDRVARAVETKVDTRQSPADQLHLLYNDLKTWVGVLPETPSEYDRVLYRRRVEIAAPLFYDLQRLQNFIALTGDYVRQEPTAERFLEVLGRLEKELFGEVRQVVPREARVRIAPPIRLEERYDEYRKNKRGVVAAVTGEMEGAIRGMLQELSKESTPISLDD